MNDFKSVKMISYEIITVKVYMLGKKMLLKRYHCLSPFKSFTKF